MRLKSPAFQHNDIIPEQYTCNGAGISPPLEWDSIPTETVSFVLICDDPDVPSTAPVRVWDHWILYNIPAHVTSLEENAHRLPSSIGEGLNTWGKTGYGGPCPPDGEHRYFFKLYALSTHLSFEEPPTKDEVERAMKGHILAEALLIGRYNQPQNQ